MLKLKVENWMEHNIRFVWHNGEWWAVLADITNALELSARQVKRRLSKDVVLKHPLETIGGIQEMLIVNEIGIYDAIFTSRKKEAKDFKKWVYNVLKTLRQLAGLEGFQVFCMLNEKHQIETMAKLHDNLKNPVKVDYIKANTISNKAASNMFGCPKMIKKKNMTPDMLIIRQTILDDTVELMIAKEKFGLEISVSNKIYDKYQLTKN